MRHRGDDGFTVAEVVIAAAIMFFVLTALVGLMGASSSMALQARQKTAMVNTVASVIDGVRASTWASIDTSWTGEHTYRPEGSGAATIVVEISVETKLAEGRPYLKVVTVQASTLAQGRPQTYSTRVAIRNPEFNQSLSSDPDAPSIEFDAEAPAEDEVLFAGERHVGGAVVLRTKSVAPADPIDEVTYELGGDPLPGASQKTFNPFGVVYTYFAAPTWDTREVDDGFQTVTVSVVDSRYRSASARRRFIIDNDPALAPGVPVGSSPSSCELAAMWTAARDGGQGTNPVGWQWAYKYDYDVLKEPLTGGADLSAWSTAASGTRIAGDTAAQAVQNAGPFNVVVQLDNPATPPLERTNRPFSRYRVRVTSSGVRTAGAQSVGATAVVTVPEMICAGTVRSSVMVSEKTGGKFTYDVVAYVTLPTFASSTAPVYTMEYKTLDGSTPATWASFAAVTPSAGVGFTKLEASRQMANKEFKLYDFRISVSNVTPSGALGGVVLPVMRTNAGRMGTGTAGTLQYLTPVWGL